jgi:monoamine oxidase
MARTQPQPGLPATPQPGLPATPQPGLPAGTSDLTTVPAGPLTPDSPESGQPSPSAAPAVPDALLATAEHGLAHRPQRAKKVIVLGAGMAGLVAAFELRRQGHEPVVLEAQNRVGGRVYTLRSRFAPGLYAEAGAMRIPRVHTLTLEYCKLFGLQLRPFVMGNAKTLLHLCGESMTFEQADREPHRLPFELSDTETGRTWTQMWDEATAEIKEVYDREGEAGWQKIMEQYDAYSLREFLESKGWSDGAIEMYGVLSFREQNMNTAVVEQFFEIVGRAFEEMQEIVGGTDRLADAFYQRIADTVRFGATVNAIEQDEDSVTVHYRNRAGRFSVTGDYAICTLPFPVLSNIEVSPLMCRRKRQAIRELRYNPSTKILFQVRHRFWEGAGAGIVGGTTATDLPIRRIVYPSHSDPDTERGVLLASYTWGQDALRWGSMAEEDRIEQALEDVAKVHPEILTEFEVGATHAWFNDPHAGGAFAQFEPGQATRIQPHIITPEGRLHFAGEHCSLYHAWIQGALESGIRAAREIHEAPEVAERTRAAREAYAG